MSGDFTKIRVSRSRLPIESGIGVKSLSNLTGVDSDDGKITHELDFGELLLVDNNTITKENPCHVYLLTGTYEEGSTNGNGQPVDRSPVFKAFSNKEIADHIVFVDFENEAVDLDGQIKYVEKIRGIKKEDGTKIPISHVSPVEHKSTDEYRYIGYDSNTGYKFEKTSGKYKILCAPTEPVYYDTQGTLKYDKGQLIEFNLEDAGIYITNKGVLYGAAWNDYAERRTCNSAEKPGTVVCDVGDGTVDISNKKLQACPYVISDTYGFCAGKGNIAVAVSGKALVYINDDVEIGDCVGAGEDGTAVKMTREEIVTYPDRILGIVCEIPTYDKWGNDVEVDGRVWINIK